MHENLMDLTGLTFFHADTIGTSDYVSILYITDLKESYCKLIRDVVPTTLSLVSGKKAVLEDKKTATGIITSEFYRQDCNR